ncbi:MAG: DUF4199 domain-containing protein [Bacteroidota bacterium]
MQRTALVFGLIAGVILILLGQFGFYLGEQFADWGEAIGYTTMLAALSMIYFGIRNQRDQKQEGHITFGQGVQLGLIITLIASVFYVVGWMVYYQNGGGVEMMEAYWQGQLEQIRQSGKSAEEIAAQIQRTEEMRASYSNPWVMAGFTFLEIFPIGLLITLIAAFLLRTKENFASENA